MIDFDEIKKTVAIEHNILLDRDDPALIAVTLNELIIQKYIDILDEKNDAYGNLLMLRCKRVLLMQR